VFIRLARPVVLLALIAAAAIAPPRTGAQGTATRDDLAFLEPWFEADRRERQTLARRGVVVRTLPAGGSQIGVLAVTPIAIDPDLFVSRMRASGGIAHAGIISGTFSDPPVVEDLASISLDEGDLDRLRRLCRPGDCRLNLAEHEIGLLQRVLGPEGSGASPGIQHAFRQVVVNRTRVYLEEGLEALPGYDDRSKPVRPAVIFSEILQQSPYVKTHVPRLAAYLEGLPNPRPDGIESFLRWSRATINDKAVIMVTHVSIVREAPAAGMPAVVVAGKQVYASRYMNGELTLTMLFAGEAGAPWYLLHASRSELDELGGSFSGIKRSLIGSRIKDEAARALAALRDALERRR
jgi:hypothetical protein